MRGRWTLYSVKWLNLSTSSRLELREMTDQTPCDCVQGYLRRAFPLHAADAHVFYAAGIAEGWAAAAKAVTGALVSSAPYPHLVEPLRNTAIPALAHGNPPAEPLLSEVSCQTVADSLNEALVKGAAADISYLSKDGVLVQRRIRPYGLGFGYVTAMDDTDGQRWTFAVHRVQAIAVDYASPRGYAGPAGPAH